MKKIILSILTFALCALWSVQVQAQGTSCGTSQIICDPNISFPASTGVASLGSISCLGSSPNPSFYTFQVSQSGVISLDLFSTPSIDIDFAIWGPFASPSGNCGGIFPNGGTVDCSYSGSAVEHIDVANAQAGQWYILLITNFNGSPTNISMAPDAGHTATLGGPLSFGTNGPFNVTDGNMTLVTNPAVTDPNVTGENFSGTGIVNAATGEFSPATAGVGTHTITLMANSYGCAVTTTTQVEVCADLSVAFTAPAPDVCIADAPVTGLGGGTPTGGVYSGSGVTNTGDGMNFTFDPTVAAPGGGNIAVTYTVGTGGCAQSASDNIYVDPICCMLDITCPTNSMISLQCISELPAGPTSVADFQALGGVINDNCNALSVSFSDSDNGAAGCAAAPRVVTRTIIVEDLIEEEEAMCVIQYTFIDNTMPGITCPADITIECDEDTSPANTGMATGNDNCGGSPAITFADVVNPGPTAQDYSITRTWTATDACGNTNTCVQTITVEDTTPPSPVCLNPTVYLEPDGTYTLQDAEVLDFVNSTDNCSPVLVADISPAVVDCDDFNTTVVATITASDESGNSAQCTANVLVQKGNALPSGWAHDDVSIAIGDAGFDPCEEKYVVESNGYAHPLTDEIHLAYQSLCGDAEIIARVVSVTPHGFGGIMIRETFDPGSKKVALRTQLRPFVHRDIRAIPNTYQQTQQLFRPQHSWLKIVRTGNSFVGYTSTNGIYWTFAFFSYVDMNTCVDIGLFAEGPIQNTTSVVCFDNVSVNGGFMPPLVDNDGNDWETNTTRAINFNVFPNPATNEVNINLAQFEGETFTLKVFNNLGQEVFRKEYLNLEAYIEKLDLGQYNNGVYMINIEMQDGTVLNKKFVVNGK